MNDASAIVVVIDGLGARYLGPYGNTWIETPAFNRLAAASFVAEQCYADSPDLSDVYRSFWTGRHAGSPNAQTVPWLPAELAGRGLPTVLLTDDLQIADHAGAGGFTERIIAPKNAAMDQSASEVAETAIARLFALAIDFLEKQSEPFLLWIHSRGMFAPWDAPLDFREQFLGEDDPPTTDDIQPARGRSPGVYDPDELLPASYAYAGQVVLIDLCLDAFLDAVAALSSERPMFLAVTAPRGYPLGEHGVIGLENAGMYEELLHLPYIMQGFSANAASQRTQALVQPADLAVTLLDFFDVDRPIPPAAPSAGLSAASGASLRPLIVDERAPWRRIALSKRGDERNVRTAHWSLRRPVALPGEWSPAERSPTDATPELFVKPDDRCDANEVASRCPQIVADMLVVMDEAEQAIVDDRPLHDERIPTEVFEPPRM